MKNTFLALSLTCALISQLRAQDQLFKKDNSKLEVKIIEINPEVIKYKLYANLSGPIYSENKSNVSLIIYESGKHEVITSNSQVPSTEVNEPASLTLFGRPGMSLADSLIYYKYSQNVSLNFFSFFNNEISLIYQKDFFDNHFSIIIPLAIGVEKPNITQSVYFENNYNNGYVDLNKKNFEAGFGINYYPNLETNINYYIGPVFKYMQYSATNNLTYRVNGINNYQFIKKTEATLLNRYCMSITNGVIIRTKSRLTTNLFASIGFKNDATSNQIKDPNTNMSVSIIRPLAFYFWCGFNVGFSF